MKRRQTVEPSRIMTVAEVAQHLRLHPAKVYKLARAGQIPVFKVGADYRFYRDEIENWMTYQQPIRVK